MSDQICPICGQGHLEQKVGKNVVEYKGRESTIETYFSTCDYCGVEQADATQLRENKRKMIAFKKQVEGLLSGEEITVIRKRLGLSKCEAARIFGGGPVAFSKYEFNDVAQSEAMDNLLRIASSVPEAFHLLMNKFDTPSMHSKELIQSNLKGRWVSIQSEGTTIPHASSRSLKIVKSNLVSGAPVWTDLKRCA